MLSLNVMERKWPLSARLIIDGIRVIELRTNVLDIIKGQWLSCIQLNW